MTMQSLTLCGALLNAHLHDLFVGQSELEIDFVHFTDKLKGYRDITGMYQCRLIKGQNSSASGKATGLNNKMIVKQNVIYG